MKYGFIKVATAIPEVRIADTKFNLEAIEKQIVMAEGQGVEIIVFPEFCITGYTCQDLFRQQLLLDDSEHAMMMLLDFTRQLDIIAIVGTPVCVGPLLLKLCCRGSARKNHRNRAKDLSAELCRVLRKALVCIGTRPLSNTNTLRWSDRIGYASTSDIPYCRRSEVRNRNLRGHLGTHSAKQCTHIGRRGDYVQPFGKYRTDWQAPLS